MKKNLKILTVALVIMAALFMRVINNENSKNLPESLQASSFTHDLQAAPFIHDCLVTPGHVSINQKNLTLKDLATVTFHLEKSANVQIQLRQKGRTFQNLPDQGMLAAGTNKLVWTNTLIKELAGGKAGEYTIRITAKNDKENASCEVPITVEF